MNRLFRQPSPGVTGYTALMLFALAYVSALAIVVAPGPLLSAFGAPTEQIDN